MAIRRSKSQFRAKAFELFRRIDSDGEPVVITHRGKPALEVRRYSERKSDPSEILRSGATYYDDPF